MVDITEDTRSYILEGIDGAIEFVSSSSVVLLEERTKSHLQYLFFPVELQLRENPQAWREKVSPFDSPYAEIEAVPFVEDEDELDNVIPPIIETLLSSVLSRTGSRGVFSPADLYAEINNSPFLQRVIGTAPPSLAISTTYQPLYSFDLGDGRQGELTLDDDTLGGLLAVALWQDGWSVLERHPAYSTLHSPGFGLSEEGLMDADDLLHRYEPDFFDKPYPPYRYLGDVLEDGLEHSTTLPYNVTFPNTNFLQGVATAAEWLGDPISKYILKVYDSDSQREMVVQ